jgi:hypothetical protein
LSLDVVAGLGTNLDGGVDLLVVAGGDEGQVLASDNASDIAGSLVTDSERVAGDGSFLHIVASLTSDEESIVASSDVDDGIDTALGSGVVDESTRVDVGVLEGKVDLLSGRSFLGWIPEVLKIDLDARSDDIGELDLAVKKRCGGPRLSNSDAF